jgi:hypothetical protein
MSITEAGRHTRARTHTTMTPRGLMEVAWQYIYIVHYNRTSSGYFRCQFGRCPGLWCIIFYIQYLVDQAFLQGLDRMLKNFICVKK